MSKHIAAVGKGGVGKTTLTTLICRYLVEHDKGTILAVDADPNANLNEALGMEYATSISEIVEDTKRPNAIPEGMTKDTYMEYKLNQSMLESEHIDLLVMGGPQGPGCYCYANDLLRKHLEDLEANYDYLVIDSEAGMEHISRRTIQDIDVMLIVSDASARGVRTITRIKELVDNLKTKVGAVYAIITKATPELFAKLQDEIAKTGVECIGYIPFDEEVVHYDAQGKPLAELPADNPAVMAAYTLFDRIRL